MALKIGITGGIGSGKSVVSKIMETMSFRVFNSDNVAKEIVNKDADIRKELIQLFGEDIYIGNQLDRQLLANKIFNDSILLTKVNGIIHPKVREAFNSLASSTNADVIFNEAAILFETGAFKMLDKTILVVAPEEVRIARVINRDHTSREEVQSRISKQWSDEQKSKLADFIIVNDGEHSVIQQVIEIVSQLISSKSSK